jgi:shikimate kinase
MNLYLIGYRCSGKTSVGRVLAQDLGRSFVDMDEEIVAREGMAIATMIAQYGWAYFRRKESEVLVEIADRNDLIVATGGGVILDKDNIRAMRHSGRVLWLRVVAETVRRRMAADEKTAANRPALSNQGLMEEIEGMLETRSPLYQKSAHYTLDSDTHSVSKLCQTVMRWLKKSDFF